MSWVEVQFTAEKEDRRSEIFEFSETSPDEFHFLDFLVESGNV